MIDEVDEKILMNFFLCGCVECVLVIMRFLLTFIVRRREGGGGVYVCGDLKKSFTTNETYGTRIT